MASTYSLAEAEPEQEQEPEPGPAGGVGVWAAVWGGDGGAKIRKPTKKGF